MATSRKNARARVLTPAVIGLVTLFGVSALAVPAQAEPRLTVAQVQARVDALHEEAAAVNEKRNELNARVAETNTRIAKVRKRIADQTKSMEKVRGQLGVFAAAAYRSGGVDSTLQLLLADDPQKFLDQSSSVDAVARSQQDTMRRVALAQQQLDQSKLELAQTLTSQKDVARQANEVSAKINAKMTEAQRVLNSLRTEERDRLVQAQRERAAAAARTSRDTMRSVSAKASMPSYTGPASGRAAAAVAFARAQVGKRYTWGGAGPNSFDCSGLTMRAWGRAGVSLPHYTNAQWAATKRVSRGDLQPGDLIFFHSDLHHVGIYIGGGVFVHAQNSATGVVVSPLAGHWSSKFAGGGRP